MRIQDIKISENFVSDLLKVNNLTKNELARLFVLAKSDMEDNGNRVKSILKYYTFLDTRNGELIRMKNISKREIKCGSLTIKPGKAITGIRIDYQFDMVEGFSTILPRTIILPSNFRDIFECSILKSLGWNLH